MFSSPVRRDRLKVEHRLQKTRTWQDFVTNSGFRTDENLWTASYGIQKSYWTDRSTWDNAHTALQQRPGSTGPGIMTSWVAFLRGINVGGRHCLSMADLRDHLAAIGCADVRTYIQSGNAVFVHRETDSSVLADDIGTAVEQAHGFRPKVVVLAADRLRKVIRANPFPAAVENPATLGIYFFAIEPSAPDLAGLEDMKLASEQFRLTSDAFYLFAPNGMGRSKLAANVEKCLGVSATARNLRTANKVLDLVAALT